MQEDRGMSEIKEYKASWFVTILEVDSVGAKKLILCAG